MALDMKKVPDDRSGTCRHRRFRHLGFVDGRICEVAHHPEDTCWQVMHMQTKDVYRCMTCLGIRSDEKLEQGNAHNGAADRGDDWNPRFRPMRRSLVRQGKDLVQQARHEVSCGVERRAGRATKGCDKGAAYQADGDGTGSEIGLAPRQAQRAQCAQHEHKRAHELVDEVIELVVRGVIRRERAEHGIHILGLLVIRQIAQHHDELADNRAQNLRNDVRQHFVPREHAVDCLADGHGRVDMRAGNAAEHEAGEHDAAGVADDDNNPAGVEFLGAFERHSGNGTIAEDQQDCRAEEFGKQTCSEGIIHRSSLSVMVGCCRQHPY